jgi:signal transduction histidine kinase
VSRRLLLSYLSLAIVVLVALEVPLGVSYARNQRGDITRGLERDAGSIGSLAEDVLQNHGNAEPLRAVAVRYADESDGNVVIIDRAGRVVVDPSSRSHPLLSARPEIAGALGGHTVTGTAGGTLYATVPIASGGTVYGAVRITTPVGEVNTRVRAYVVRLLAIAAVVLGLVALVGWLLSRSIARPLRAVEAAAERAGSGDLTARAPEGTGPAEVRALARSFNDMVTQVEQLLHAQEAFVADASHQLRTPLTALRLRLENGDVPGALGEVERLARLVDGLLALARAEAAPPGQVDLAAAVAERVDAWQPVAAERDVRLEADVRGEALADRDRLGQVLDNLLANAIAVAPPGSAVTVSGQPGELHVRDRGPGMSEDERRRAFDRFWSKGAGSGLGLPIVKRLLAVDGGSVELFPADRGGLDVVLRLRQRRETPVSRAASATARATAGATSRLKTPGMM